VGLTNERTEGRSYRVARRARKFLLYSLLVLVVVLYSVPMIWLVSTSLKEEGRVFSKTIEWLPRPPTLENYRNAFAKYPLARWLLNSAIVAVVTVSLTILISVPAGYALARAKLKGSSIMFGLCLLSLMVPIEAYLVPLYIIFSELRLVNKYVGLVLPQLSNGFAVFLIRQFVQQIPKELEEAAIIDGASRWQVLTRIVAPNLTPALATVIIFRFMASWNSFAWPLIAASSDAVKTQPVGLAIHVFGVVGGSMASPRYGLSMAAAFVATLPTIIVFLAMQRYFVEGIATSGLK
jgi:ABC-type glycerol-3-phosphate transport system permease component